MRTQTIERANVLTVLEHSISALHPLHTPDQFQGLLNNIRLNGQKEPVKMYRGKLVDGRHRLKALKQLGIEYIEYITLPNNLTIEQVKDAVIASEVRRHQTPTQLALTALALYDAGGVTQEEACAQAQANVRILQRALAIQKLGRNDILMRLHSGKLFDVSTTSKFAKPTDSLGAILQYLKDQQFTDAVKLQATAKLDTAAESAAQFSTVLADGLLATMKALSDVERSYILQKLVESM